MQESNKDNKILIDPRLNIMSNLEKQIKPRYAGLSDFESDALNTIRYQLEKYINDSDNEEKSTTERNVARTVTNEYNAIIVMIYELIAYRQIVGPVKDLIKVQVNDGKPTFLGKLCDNTKIYKCPECGNIFYRYSSTKYCENCGCRFDFREEYCEEIL